MIAAHVVKLLMGMIVQYNPVEQVAVSYVKESIVSLPLFLCTFFVVTFCVPITEELLFRGYVHAWLRRFVSPKITVLIGSLFFTAMHFSMKQGWSNIELTCSLFVLSCSIGFLYEKYRSLWVSIGLHSSFNLLNVSLILLT